MPITSAASGAARRIASYSSGQPEWETVLDLDALAASEKANWVWNGATCARPAERRCLIIAVRRRRGCRHRPRVRPFDQVLRQGRLRPSQGQAECELGGREHACSSPANGSRVSWRKAGYPYIVKRLQPRPAAIGRGRSLSRRPERRRLRRLPLRPSRRPEPHAAVDHRGRSIPSHSETYILGPKGARKVAIPTKTTLGRHGRRPGHHPDARRLDTGRKRQDLPGRVAALGRPRATASADPAHLKPTLIYTPGPREALEGATRGQGRAARFDPRQCPRPDLAVHARRRRAAGPARRSSLPDNSTIGVADTSRRRRPALMTVTNFLTPPSLWLADAGNGHARARS